ncbi:phospholipid-transporting ATPase 2-like [Hibiscus syriacus]|uniref:phospholipid-transporting ATPase 2-like n=1 Tax=Hibiscus syriacus TaxID=106335 RepID=UPI00192091B0|nr:phospholipid-transporting ATPase 2-like [Hibiscus syriacus]
MTETLLNVSEGDQAPTPSNLKAVGKKTVQAIVINDKSRFSYKIDEPGILKSKPTEYPTMQTNMRLGNQIGENSGMHQNLNSQEEDRRGIGGSLNSAGTRRNNGFQIFAALCLFLQVSLDLVKSLYAKFIDWDSEMIDYETGIPSHATNTAISEDLGQVEYIMTDKTGTLTENRMIFRRCCINGVFYGNESGDALKDDKLLNAVAGSSLDVIQFVTVMAICNIVIPIKSKTGAILYKAQSQDEDALVNAAAQLHMVYANKNANILEIRFNGSIIKYELLEILEFTSDRKRMSVVVKDCQNGKILLLSKGADGAILPYAYDGQQTRTFIEVVEQYAQLGLRTLCLAWRELKEDEYQEWSLMFKEASSTLVDREWRIAEVCQRLEHEFEVLGVTAIEDCLQDGVPETIETLRKAGINFWMLTGDKQNTAIEIALSCNFISPARDRVCIAMDEAFSSGMPIGVRPHEAKYLCKK